ncbi:hypothetical protein P376_4424 [Streptomyces sp. HCCB10043]|nr:hypothetical protein P376_4424 [Streptomyces sp. HCCB10043]
MHDERPVRAPLARQQPPEQRQRVRPPEPGDLAPERPPDHEVRALALPDLVPDHPPHDVRVLLVRHIEAAVHHGHVMGGQRRQHLRELQLVRLVGDQHAQRRPVVADVEAALGDLPERHQGQRGRRAHRQIGQPARLPHPADQEFDVIVVTPGCTAAQQRERRGVLGQQPADEGRGGSGRGLGHGSRFLPDGPYGDPLGIRTGFTGRGTAPEHRKGRPSGGLREVSAR